MLILLQRLLAEKLAAMPSRLPPLRPAPIARPQPPIDAAPAVAQPPRAAVSPVSAAPQPAVAAAPAAAVSQIAAAEAAIAYWVYTNSRNRYSRVHQSSCSWYRRPRAARQTDNGWWHGPYDRRDLAEASPQNIGAVAACGHCLG